MAQYHHQQPYSGLALPKLRPGGQSHAPVTQEEPTKAAKQPGIRPKQQNSFVSLSVQYVNIDA